MNNVWNFSACPPCPPCYEIYMYSRLPQVFKVGIDKAEVIHAVCANTVGLTQNSLCLARGGGLSEPLQRVCNPAGRPSPNKDFNHQEINGGTPSNVCILVPASIQPRPNSR